MKRTWIRFSLCLVILFLTVSQSDAKPILHTVAEKPPMGWNSFDAYDCAISEEQFRKVVTWLSENLLDYGWEYVTIDYPFLRSRARV